MVVQALLSPVSINSMGWGSMTRRMHTALAALLTTIAGVGLIAVGPASPAGAATGPGSYYLVRSQATGRAPSAADDAKCDAYLGFPRNLATIQRLDAVINAPVVSPVTGEIINGVAAPVAPAYLCGALGADGGLIQSYAKTTFAGAGAVQVAGPCDIALAAAQPGAALADCRLSPVPGTGTQPGVITTNSVVNPLNVEGAQTGSLITAYFPGVAQANDGPPPSAAPAPVPGANFYVLRDAGSRIVTGSADCPIGWRARVSTVKAAQVARTSGRVAPASGADVGSVTVCLEKKTTTGDVNAKAVLRLGSKTLKSEGVCRHTALPGIGTSVAQTCGLWLKAPFLTIQDGLLTGTLLVPSGDSAGSTDSGVWTFASLT
jgi:hypothetical protein